MFNCQISTDKQFSVGESVKLTFTLQNTGGRTLHVLKWYTPLEGFAGKILRITKDQDPIQYRGILAKRGKPIREDYIEVPSGERVVAELLLNECYDLSEPGKYEVGLETKIFDVVDDPEVLPRNQNDHRPIDIKCPSVRFTINPRTTLP